MNTLNQIVLPDNELLKLPVSRKQHWRRLYEDCMKQNMYIHKPY